MFDKDNKFGFISNNESNNNIEGLDNIKSDIKNIKNDVDELNTQYKDIVSKIENGNIGNNIEPQLMDMPRIYFSEGTLPTSKTATVMKFDYYSKTNEYHGYVDIKCQGNSSMAYPKKNFTIKPYKDKAKTSKLKIDFKGWGKQSKFVLKANWIDISHLRNVVSARLWGDVVKTRSDYATALPELLRTSPNQGAIDGFPVLVYANGVYQGRYTLNIPKDGWMSNMDDALDTHCILCGENYGSGCFRAAPVIDGTDWSDELHDVVPATIKTSWTNVINFVMTSSDAEFKANLSNYFDVNSLIDYLLYGIVSTGLDAFGKNQIYFTYDGIKWIASMYDLDSTWGLWWNGQSFVSTSYAREEFQDLKDEGNGVTKQGNLLYLRLQQLFIPQLKTRYTELRKDVLSVSHIIQKFEEFNDICPKDIVQEDYASTTGEGKFTGIPSKTTNNIQQLRSYINARLTYVDGYINALQEDTPCTNITLNNATLSFTTDAAQTLTATLTPTDTTDKVVWSVSPTGICTVEDGVVTAIKNGTCVITATCGSHSATCNVTVNLPSVACTSIALDKTALQLGTIESSTPDTETNLLEGLSWKDGQLNDNTGIMGTGTDKCIANIPIPATGLYTLSCSVKYTYPKIFLYNNDNQLIRSNIGNNNNNSLSIYVYEPNCHISISLFPNSLEFSENNVTLKYTHNMADTPNKDTDIQASAIANFNLLITSGDYKIIELYADKVYTDIAALKLGSTTYKLYNWNVVSGKNLGANANDAAISITRMNNGYCTKGEWAGKTFFNIAVPSTWGDTKEDIINYIQTNNIAVIMNPSEYLNSADKIGSTTINSYQLKPTIQPNNCTDIVEWSTSPEGIVTANNGLVKAVRNGEAVVTATCGTKSATCNVTVSGISTNILYTLPQETTFNGTSDYIDTGVQLFKTDQDFTITMDVTADNDQVQDTACIFHCMKEASPYPGITFHKSGASKFGLAPGNNTSAMTDLIDYGQRAKVVIVKNGTTMKVYTSNGTNKESAYNFTSIEQTLLLGAYQPISGNKGRFFKGTIYEFSIIKGAYTAEQISEYLGKIPDGKRVFKIDSTCMNTESNKLTDSISGIAATLGGAPTVRDNQIVFTENDKFNFDLNSLNLSNNNRTFRIKFTPTTFDTNTRCIYTIGVNTTDWNGLTSAYITNEKLIMQHGSKLINNSTVAVGGSNGNRLPEAPAINTEYEIVITEQVNTGNVRWFVNGTLVQDGTTTLYSPLVLGNTEGNNRFVGSYSLIEIYGGFCDTYEDFTNMANTKQSSAVYSLATPTTFNGTSDFIDTGVKLFDTAKDFTIYIDFTEGTGNEKNSTIFHCINEQSPYRGLNLANGGDNTYFLGGQNANVVGHGYVSNIATGKYLIEFKNGVISRAFSSTGELTVAKDAKTNSPYEQFNQNLLLGCYQTTDGTKGRYWNGTINKFNVWFRTLTTEEINALLV